MTRWTRRGASHDRQPGLTGKDRSPAFVCWGTRSWIGSGGSGRLAGGYGSLGETEHVSAFRVVGAASAFVGRQRAIRVNLALEALQELLARWPGAGTPVGRAAPRDLRRY